MESKRVLAPGKFDECTYCHFYSSSTEELVGVRINFFVGEEEFVAEVRFKDPSVTVIEYKDNSDFVKISRIKFAGEKK